jgi:lysozyme
MQDEAMPLLLALIERFEGLRLRPYICPAGVPTIGLGSTRYEDGTPVKLTDPAITRERAYAIARHQIAREYLPQTLALCQGIDTPGRLAAIVDFSYNLGTGALRSSTLRKRINAGRWDDVPGELMKWVRGGGRVLPGLVARRKAESALTR